MRKSLWKAFAWQGVGLLFYLAGMLLFMVVAINVYLSPPANSLGNLSEGHVVTLLASVALIAIGRMIGWKFGYGGSMVHLYRHGLPGQRPEQSQLQEMGYRIPPEPDDRGPSDVVYEDGELFLVCRECGTQNESEFSYCSNCSSELPEA